MRLICPNCGAQYEVDDRVIPDAGRDVQCSNCGHGWFQKKPTPFTPAPQDEIEPETETEVEAAPTPRAAATSGAPSGMAWEDEYPEEDEDDQSGDLDALESAAEAAALAMNEEDQEDLDEPLPDDMPLPPRREVDAELREMLKEEAEREMRARTEERDPMESQPDLGIAPPDEDAARAAARERLAMMTGSDDPDSDYADDYSSLEARHDNRGEVFPDIDEINSTLETPTAASASTVAKEKRQRSGFRRGFSIVILLAVIAYALYALAPQIAEAVPALAPALDAYVTAVNGLILSIDGWMQGVIASLEDAAAGGE